MQCLNVELKTNQFFYKSLTGKLHVFTQWGFPHLPRDVTPTERIIFKIRNSKKNIANDIVPKA